MPSAKESFECEGDNVSFVNLEGHLCVRQAMLIFMECLTDCGSLSGIKGKSERVEEMQSLCMHFHGARLLALP